MCDGKAMTGVVDMAARSEAEGSEHRLVFWIFASSTVSLPVTNLESSRALYSNAECDTPVTQNAPEQNQQGKGASQTSAKQRAGGRKE